MYSVSSNVGISVRIKTKGEDDCEWYWEYNNKRDVRMTVKIITGSYASSLRHLKGFHFFSVSNL